MLERTFKDIKTWVAYLSQADLPVLALTAQRLAALREKEDQVGGREIAGVVLQDPLMTLKVLAYIESHRRRSQNADITTIARAIMMLGIAPFFRNFDSLQTVEAHLQNYPQGLAGLAHVVTRARRAAHYAHDWALLRHDLESEEVAVAALLHDIAEILLWCFAPALALRIQMMLEQNHGLRSKVAQTEVIGFALHDLQLALAQAWRLPKLLVTLMDDQNAHQLRVRNAVCAVNLARHSTHGWDDPALPDDYAEIEKLLNLSREALLARIDRDDPVSPGL